MRPHAILSQREWLSCFFHFFFFLPECLLPHEAIFLYLIDAAVVCVCLFATKLITILKEMLMNVFRGQWMNVRQEVWQVYQVDNSWTQSICWKNHENAFKKKAEKENVNKKVIGRQFIKLESCENAFTLVNVRNTAKAENQRSKHKIRKYHHQRIDNV